VLRVAHDRPHASRRDARPHREGVAYATSRRSPGRYASRALRAGRPRVATRGRH